MSNWSTISCAECGTDFRICDEWDHPPKLCKPCREEKAAQFYERDCEDCGATMRIHREWENPPTICKECRVKRNERYYDVSCEFCNTTIRANRDWDRPPKYCKECKERFPAAEMKCEHCGDRFTVSTSFQLKCKKNEWELPRKCDDCRELFRHKPFKTVRETTMFGRTIFRTYNSKDQLISESEDQKDFWGNEYRQHSNPEATNVFGQAKKTGTTHSKKTMWDQPYRETRREDGAVKSTSEKKADFWGNKYTESTGGASNAKHTTQSKESSIGKLLGSKWAKWRETK